MESGGSTERPNVGIAVATTALLIAALAFKSTLVFGFVVLAAVFVPMERLLSLNPQRTLRAGWRTDVAHFFVNNLLGTVGLVVVVGLLAVGVRAAVPPGLKELVLSQGALLQFVEAMALAAVCGYWAHRATHKVPFLWRFHAVHHSIQEMDWLAAGRLHPIDQVFTRTCTVLPLFALGFSRATFGAFVGFAGFQAIFVHANVRVRFGLLRWMVATPEFHHWHHANQPEAHNTNFAGEFPFVDALFGTLHLPKGTRPAVYGIDDPVPEGYLGQLAWPFRSRLTAPVAPSTSVNA